MNSPAKNASLTCDTGLEPGQTEAEQNSEASWLDLVDWTLLDGDVWVDGGFGSISNEDFTDEYDFQGFDGQFFEARATSTSSQHHSASVQETTEWGERSTERTEPGLQDCADSISDNEVSEGGGLQEAWRPGRGRSQRPEILLSGGRPAPCPSPSPRRKGRLSDLVRKGMEELKHAKGACWRCKILRKKCDVDQPCRACPRRGGQTAWQLIGCQRGRLEMQIKICLFGTSRCPIPLHELQTRINHTLAAATRSCHLKTNDLQEDPNCSSVTPALSIGNRGRRLFVERGNHTTASFTANRPTTREIRTGCSGCSECLHLLKYPSNTHHQYDFRKCFIRLLWELTDHPSTILQLKMGSISQIRELLKAASRYAAEVGDVPCLELWRLRSHGLFYRGMHASCVATREEGCQFKPFADLQHGIQQYTTELSKVFFRKKALQSDRRWWLSVFYSLLIQSPVRQTLLMIQAETDPGLLIKDSGPTQCSQYCHTALNIFDAASAGWDPINSDGDLQTLLSGSDIDQKVARHVKVAREAILKDRRENEPHNSFELLRSMFDMDMSTRVRRRISTRRISSKDSIAAMTPQPALFAPNASQTPPPFGDSRQGSPDHFNNHDSEAEFSIQPPLPPPRFVPVEEWESLRGYRAGTNKRRATSPPQEDDERRLSTDNFPLSLSTADNTSDRANSISSMNSFSSINAAYGTLALESPGSGQSSRLMSSSPYSTTPDNMQKPGNSLAISAHELIRQRSPKLRTNAAGIKLQGFYMCDCCPKKPKKFDTREELCAHEAEKAYECAYCGNRFRDKNEAERHQNSLHVRSHSWSCSALGSYESAFYDSKSQPGQADTCGFCGVDFEKTATTKFARYPSDDDWEKRIAHLEGHHKFLQCNFRKKFYRTDHFRQHLKHSHGSLSGDWLRYLEERAMQKEETLDDRERSSGREFGTA